MAQYPATITFGDQNSGSQVGQNNGTINNEFHLEQLETPPKPFPSIPFRRDADFIDRGDYLSQLDRCCLESAGRIALVGLGGVGKSQLAIEFAHRIAEARSDVWVFWIHAATQTRVEEGFRMIADAVALTGRNQPKADIPLLVQSWLSIERNGRWIIILDSADNCEVLYGDYESGSGQRPLATYLPQSRNGSVVVTTRSRDVASRLAGRENIIEVGPMAETDALDLLKKKLGSLSDIDMAKNFLHALECVPLAITQAAAYIQARAPRSSIKKYLDEFQRSKHQMVKLLNHDAGDLQRDGAASNAILKTWQISFDYIHSQQPSAADLLSLMSFFDRQGILEWLLKPPVMTTDASLRAGGLDETGNSESETSGDDSNSEVDGDAGSTFADDIAMLRDYCLITMNEEGNQFEMHRLVQLSMKNWLKAYGRHKMFEQQYIKRMAASFPPGDYENWAICRDLFAHVQAALDCRPSENTLKEWATLCYNGGLYAHLQGRYDLAERMANKAMKAREKKLGKNDASTLRSLSLLASVISAKGRWEEAEKLQVQDMEICKIQLGPEHPDTLISMNNLASLYAGQGRWEEAEKLQVQGIDICKIKLGLEHLNTLASMNNLASTYWEQGRWEEAEKLQVQVMEIHKIKLGPDHPNTLTSMNNLASIYGKQGQWEEAEKLQVQVMEISKIKLGPNHPNTLTSMNNLASIYGKQGQWEEAEKLQVQGIDICKIKLGLEHPNTLVSINNLASTYWEQGRWEEAEKLQVQVMEIWKIQLGPEHPDTLTSMNNLASTYRSQGRWEEAKKLQVQVMEIRKTKLGPDHPETLTSMNNLAITWKDQGRDEDALALMKDCLQASQRVLGLEHPHTLSYSRSVGKWSKNISPNQAGRDLPDSHVSH